MSSVEVCLMNILLCLYRFNIECGIENVYNSGSALLARRPRADGRLPSNAFLIPKQISMKSARSRRNPTAPPPPRPSRPEPLPRNLPRLALLRCSRPLQLLCVPCLRQVSCLCRRQIPLIKDLIRLQISSLRCLSFRCMTCNHSERAYLHTGEQQRVATNAMRLQSDFKKIQICCKYVLEV